MTTESNEDENDKTVSGHLKRGVMPFDEYGKAQIEAFNYRVKLYRLQVDAAMEMWEARVKAYRDLHGF